MAFNSWDKLSKAQRDYPKPKFAVAVVDKALKKHPNNPYLLTWKADLSLQQNGDPHVIVPSLQNIYHMSIVDIRLLSYLYRLSLEAARRAHKNGLIQSSVGQNILTNWSAAAKTTPRKEDRLELWNELFCAAMQEDCWQDVRFAILNFGKEGQLNKKQAQYSLILATQLAAEQALYQSGSEDRMAQMQADLALKLMKQAFTAPPDDPVAVKDIRDLRFMAEIFRRQDRVSELERLWDDPPKHLIDLIMNRHREDLMTLLIRLFRERGEWLQLERHCLRIVTENLGKLQNAGNSKSSLWELCAWRWDVWGALLDAIVVNHQEREGRQIIRDQLEKCFGVSMKAKDRPLQLTYMRMRHFAGLPMLSDCKTNYENHCHLSSCFDDLRPFVEGFDYKTAFDFRSHLNVCQARFYQADSPAVEDENSWRIPQFNLIKFEYLLTASWPYHPVRETLEQIFKASMRLSRVWPENSDPGALAIFTLLQVHHRFVCREEGRNPLEVTLNSRVLLQATMYARHLVEKDKDKQNRTFSILAARLHLNLGLGTIAFRLYSHAKCKEMLLDTLSLYVLSRISQTHPFDVTSYGGFSADEELAKVISAIERMEDKTDSYLYTDVTSFAWDQAVDTLGLKRKLNSSLTKHLCATERRRIARLRGESMEGIPRLDFKTYKNICDNVDRKVFPNFEHSACFDRVLHMIMPNAIPNVHWLPESHCNREVANMVLFKEFSEKNFFDPLYAKHKNDGIRVGLLNETRTERRLGKHWRKLNILLKEVWEPLQRAKISQEDFDDFFTLIHVLRLSLEKLRMPGSTTLRAEDEPTMFHENMLMACYAYLELLRGTYRFVEILREKVVKPKGKQLHPHKKILRDKYDTELLEETQVCFQAVRDVAQSYIDLLKTKGVQAIVAQVRWGRTGEELKVFLSDDDVDYYAREYVESALEAWNGVLKVKLK